MTTLSEPAPSTEGSHEVVVSVVDGKVRIHSLKHARQGLDPKARQVFAGSPAELAAFFRDIQAGVSAGAAPPIDRPVPGG